MLHEIRRQSIYSVIYKRQYDATKAIRAMDAPHCKAIPILAMTANAFEEDRQDAIADGMNGHLAKPIDLNTLLKTLSELLS